jgi:hypothetical protein
MTRPNRKDGARPWLLALLLLTAVWHSTALAEVTLVLKQSFIEKYKDRATIEADFIVDHSKGKPNSAAKDGDMHVAGRSPKDIGLATVAEIMNAKDEPEAVAAANAAAGTKKPIRVNGAWRIWNEHGGDDTRFVQGRVVAAANDSNPDHIFEIHPISSIDGRSTAKSFRPISGYTPKKAEDAFNRYENVRSRISIGNGTVTIVSPGVGYNYVNFQMELNAKPDLVSDGALAYAKVQDFDGDLILHKRRMVFVKDTPPYDVVRDKSAGDCLRVLGMPRMDLALVSWRAQNVKTRPEVLSWNLPYEMIIVGVYNEPCEKD